MGCPGNSLVREETKKAISLQIDTLKSGYSINHQEQTINDVMFFFFPL
jgi:hypothetical protein